MSIATSLKTTSTKPLLFTKTKAVQPRFSERTSERGFTLFEILIVVSILAGAIAFLVPKAIRTDSGVKKVSRHILVLSRDVRNQARLKNSTYRIVFKMDGDKHSYWVEAAAGNQPGKSQEQLEEESRLSEDVRPTNPFKKVDKFTKDAYELPKDLYFGQIETLGERAPVTNGEVYINYSPQGLTESAAIQLTDRKDTNWTLIINPLTGHVTIVNKKISLKEAKQE